MKKLIATNRYSFEEIKARAKEIKRLVYAFGSGWWKIGDPVYKNNRDVPCGPRGEMLFETDDPEGFLTAAEANESFYGKHGIKALVLAYHGNLTNGHGRPTSLEDWSKYNNVLDNLKNEKNYIRYQAGKRPFSLK